jgi:aspartate aminotransferase
LLTEENIPLQHEIYSIIKIVLTVMQISKMAQGLVGSEIIKLAGEINEKIAQGEQIYNFTILIPNFSLFPQF